MDKPKRGKRAFKTWGECFRACLRKGYDHGYCAHKANMWEDRKDRQKAQHKEQKEGE